MIGERTKRTTNETPLSDNTAGHCTPSKKYNVGKQLVQTHASGYFALQQACTNVGGMKKALSTCGVQT